MRRQTLKAPTLAQIRAAMTRYDAAAAVVLRLGAGHLGMIWVGAALGGAGFLACCVLEGRSYMRRWLLYVYAFAFLAFSFVLLMEWFEVSGASGLRP